MNALKRIYIIGLLLFLSAPVMAGFSSYEKDYRNFRYETTGEISVKPDRAVFPLIITTRAKSYKDSLGQAEMIIADIEQGLKKLDNKVFSFSNMDFAKPDERGSKSIQLSFFGNDEETSKTRIVSYLHVSFTDGHGFRERSAYIAEALDFIKSHVDKYKKYEHRSVLVEDMFYEIENPEQYRVRIVESIYQKARIMADSIARQEKTKAKIKRVSFEQHIKQEILNFYQAQLSIDGVIEYTFE